MATEDQLIREIDEDMQRQRYLAIWKKYGNWIITGALAIIIATASYSSWKNYREKRDQTATDSLLALLMAQDADSLASADKLAAFAAEQKSAQQAVLARFYEAEVRKKNKQTVEALAIYDAIAADGSVNQNFRQLATLYSVQGQLDDGDIAALKARLEPLAGSDAPWRYTAHEYQGLLALRANDKPAAAKIFGQLAQDPQAPGDVRQRAQDLARYYGDQ